MSTLDHEPGREIASLSPVLERLRQRPWNHPEPPEGCWDRIGASLPPMPTEQRSPFMRWPIRTLWIGIAAGLALLIAALWSLRPAAPAPSDLAISGDEAAAYLHEVASRMTLDEFSPYLTEPTVYDEDPSWYEVLLPMNAEELESFF